MSNNPFFRDTTILQESEYLKYLKGEENLSEFIEPVAGLAVAALAAMAAKKAVAMYTRDYTLNGRKCQAASKGDKAAYAKCLHQAKLSAEMKKLAVFKDAKSKCNKSKEPDKCVIRMANMIKKQEHVIAKLKEKK